MRSERQREERTAQVVNGVRSETTKRCKYYVTLPNVMNNYSLALLVAVAFSSLTPF